jgi:hypothetical protein
LDLSALRAGVVILEICDVGDGRLDGVITVSGSVADLIQDVAEILTVPDVDPDQVRLLRELTMTIDLIQTRSPDADGADIANRPLPQVEMTLADLGSGDTVRVVYGASDSPVILSPDETPVASDGTGIID